MDALVLERGAMTAVPTGLRNKDRAFGRVAELSGRLLRGACLSSAGGISGLDTQRTEALDVWP